MYVKLENNIVIRWPIEDSEIRMETPNSSLPQYIDHELALKLGFGEFVSHSYPLEYDPKWQNIEEITPQLRDDGKYHQSYKITEKYTPEEKKSKQDEQKRDLNKAQAESLLQTTDWTEGKSVRDVTRTPHLVNGDEFDDYRVALRAIVVNPPETEIADWPVKPEEVWSNQ